MSEGECGICQEDPKKECVPAQKTKEGQACYSCVDKPEECIDLGLLSEGECGICQEDPKKECVPAQKTKEGQACYSCVDKPEECIDLGLLSEGECGICQEDPKKECVPAQKTKEGQACYSCVDKPEEECIDVTAAWISRKSASRVIVRRGMRDLSGRPEERMCAGAED